MNAELRNAGFPGASTRAWILRSQVKIPHIVVVGHLRLPRVTLRSLMSKPSDIRNFFSFLFFLNGNFCHPAVFIQERRG